MPGKSLNLSFAPRSYFGPQSLENYVVSRVKGAIVKDKLKALLRDGRLAEFNSLFANGVPEDEFRLLEAVDPAFMGGNSLPDFAPGEIEIARVQMISGRHDVVAIYVQSDHGQLRYRIVDEYNGRTLRGDVEIVRSRPLKLAEVVDYLFGVWPLADILRNEFGGVIESAIGFFKATSDFYPDFGRLCIRRVADERSEHDRSDAIGRRMSRASSLSD